MITFIIPAALLVIIYGALRRPCPSARKFPDGFLWATGEDACQHEGWSLNNDWARWEAQEPPPIESGERCGIAADFYNRYESDFYLAARDGQNAYRFGIEWSRRRDATTRAPSCITTK
ncbi:MAG TPA: family 1 glycosylhydrolase [Spirochaetota bacterium]|nr:family 1 glycosylhydrolase [Spirochaetota bacterium]